MNGGKGARARERAIWIFRVDVSKSLLLFLSFVDAASLHRITSKALNVNLKLSLYKTVLILLHSSLASQREQSACWSVAAVPN